MLHAAGLNYRIYSFSILHKIKNRIYHSIAIIAAIICWYSCKKQPANIKIFTTNNLTVVDSSSEANQFLPFNSQYDYPIYFMGLKRDTIKIGRRYARGHTEWKNDFDIPRTENYSASTLQIIVDTSVKTNSPVEYFSDNLQTSKDSASNYHSFLLLINNISDSAIYLGHSFSLYFINREAKDSSGHWARVEKPLAEMSICATGEPFIIFKPHELIISKVKRYNGLRLTDFRIAFGYNNNVVYSNTFKDFIDDRMFKNAGK